MRIGEIFALPARTCIDYELNGNLIRQIDRPACNADVVSTRHDARGRHVGHVVRTKTGAEVLVMERRTPDEDWTGETLWSDRRAVGWSWGRPDSSDRQTVPGTLLARSAVLESLRGRASLKDEVRDAEGNVTEPGLRAPQVGAVHGALAHWKGSDDLATVVLPTGTGKTETMLTLFAWERFGLLLIVVPTDALRTQIADKFQTMGLLGLFGILTVGALLPVVGVVEHAFDSADGAADLMRRCNIVVATMAVLDACSADAREQIADLCPYLFIDEAHHGEARTWQEFRTLFLNRPRNRALQFTATPYRGDGRLVDGRVVFNYPLRKARAAGYFSKMSLLPVFSWNEDTADDDIAEAALSQLDRDEAAGFEHVVMARTSSIARAIAVTAIYQRLAPHRREREPGARVGDLYEVCGQAQRSIRWSMDPEGMFGRLLLRENQRVTQGRSTRFDKGDARKLEALKTKARFKDRIFYVHVVQPGLCASRAGQNQLELLAATEVYTQETFQIALNVIGSE